MVELLEIVTFALQFAHFDLQLSQLCLQLTSESFGFCKTLLLNNLLLLYTLLLLDQLIIALTLFGESFDLLCQQFFIILSSIYHSS